MKEYPILFNTPMVQLILAGKKTMTSRLLTPRNSKLSPNGDWSKLCWDGSEVYKFHWNKNLDTKAPLPFVDKMILNWEYLHVPYNYTQDGTVYRLYSRYEETDWFWVKESWCEIDTLVYKADSDYSDYKLYKWKSSIFMPRRGSRIILEIIAIKCRQLLDVSQEDVTKEGFGSKEEFWQYFKVLNKHRMASVPNPWIWSYEFKRLE